VTGDLLSAVTAAAAVSVELLEALAIVVAVAVARSWRDAVLGAVAAICACALLAALGAGALQAVPTGTLQLVIGVFLLLFGLEWLRKGTLRLAGRRARSSARGEFEETLAELEGGPERDGPDWTARAIAFKGVLLEGVEIVLIVSVLAAQPGQGAPALIGAAIAVAIALALGWLLRARLATVPETELKWGVGVMLTAFGLFFCGEGLDAGWPGGELALLYCAGAIALVSERRVRRLQRPGAPA